MGSMKDHFLGDRPYPMTPGFKEPTTSRDAAKVVSGRAEHLRDRVLTAIGNAGSAGLTADEAATRIDETPFAIRPRVTELSLAGKIERTGKRRRNPNGGMAAVWRIKP